MAAIRKVPPRTSIQPIRPAVIPIAVKSGIPNQVVRRLPGIASRIRIAKPSPAIDPPVAMPVRRTRSQGIELKDLLIACFIRQPIILEE